MKTFNFYQDVELTVWERHNFEIEAETKEEAINMIKDKMKEVKFELEHPLFEGDTETLYDTSEFNQPIGSATVQVYDNENDNELFNNWEMKP